MVMPKPDFTPSYEEGERVRVSKVGATTEGLIWLVFTSDEGEQFSLFIDGVGCERLLEAIPATLDALASRN